MFKSRSTWACELKLHYLSTAAKYGSHAPRERVSWNCIECVKVELRLSHAPRERVSWNTSPAAGVFVGATGHAPRERVSWNRKELRLHCRQRRHAPRERVSWNKQELDSQDNLIRHAPRERVSWNRFCLVFLIYINVTLHVSVWVEIISPSLARRTNRRHAPRERVSWNSPFHNYIIAHLCHAPRERVSWNFESVKVVVKVFVTLHVSVWVEMHR